MIPLSNQPQNSHKYSLSRTPNKLNAHQERLKNYKLMYDQLHRSQVHTFVIRKKHLQSDHQKSHREERSQQIIDSTSYQKKQTKQLLRLPSMQTQQITNSKSEPKSTKQQKIKNIQIIKKMLQISGNNRISFRQRIKNSEGDMGDEPIFSQKLNINQQVYKDRRNSKFMHDYNATESGFKRRVVNNRSSALDDTGANKKEQKRQRNNNSEMNKHPASMNQIQSISKNKQKNKYDIKGRKALKSLQKQQYKQQKLKQPSLSQSLLSYVKFINAPSDIQEMHIHFNFGSIRKMSMAQAWKNLDLKNAKMIQALLTSMHAVLYSQCRKSLQSAPEVEGQFLQDCCRLYFNNYEKAKLELILKQHYFKLFAFKLNPIFVYQRIAMYLCYIMCDNQIINSAWYRDKIKSMMNSLKIIYSIIINIITQTQFTRHSIKSIINATLPKSPIQSASINQTFQLLRSVSQIQKHLVELEKLINAVTDQNKYSSVSEVERTLKLFLKEQPYGFGNRSYQNFIKTQMLLSWKYLQVPPTPFLPPIKSQYKFTIVLDLDQTLIYYNQQTNILKYRPFLDTFFKKLASMNFQIISFSASSKNYADAMIQEIQRKTRIFQYRLYKEHLSLHQGRLVKDLRRLGRNISKVIIVDDMSVNFSSCQDNGIQVTSWHGNKSDRQLIQILTVLNKLEKFDQRNQERKYDDLRKLIKDEKKRLDQMLEKTDSNEFIQ